MARCRFQPGHHHRAAADFQNRWEGGGSPAENQERLPGDSFGGTGSGRAAKPARENPQRVCVPFSQRRAHLAGQCSEYAPPGAETGGVALCAVPRPAPHLRYSGPPKRGGRENRLFHSRPLQRWFHPGHLRPRHHHRPAGGSEEDGRGFGAEGSMRKIPGAGMRWYPLQSLTQTKGEAV